MSEEKVTVLKKDLDRLLKRDMFLTALEHSGVDNWSGYEHARALRDEWEEGEDDES